MVIKRTASEAALIMSNAAARQSAAEVEAERAELVEQEKTARQAKETEAQLVADKATAELQKEREAQLEAELAELKEEERLRNLTPEQRCIEDWNSNPALQVEFKELAVYIAFKKAEAQGRVFIIGGRVIK